LLFVICYDIADDRRRRRVDKTLSGFGVRVQESVFEAELNEKRYIEMQRKLAKVISMQEDNVRYYRLCRSCRSAIDVMGVAFEPFEQEEILVF